jgi:hypothetical protein
MSVSRAREDGEVRAAQDDAIEPGDPRLSDEIGEEARRLAANPMDEVGRLEKVAARGESGATPLIALTGVFGVVLVLFAIVVAVAFAAYYLGG